MEVDPIKPSEEIDIEVTDDESESEYDETESDRDFIIPDDLSEVGDDRPYVPLTDDNLSSSEDDNTTEILEYYGDEGSLRDGITVLGERCVMEEGEGRRQLLIRGWVDEGVVAGMTRTANCK